MATPDRPADLLVVFGITGDLAKVMTFRSLYRLERRGLLTCPIVGVAGRDWTDDQLRAHARTSIEDTGEAVDPAVFRRLADRLSYVAGDFGTPPPTGAWPRRPRAPSARCSTWRSRPSCSPPWWPGWPTPA